MYYSVNNMEVFVKKIKQIFSLIVFLSMCVNFYAQGKNVTWKSSDKSVVTVSSKGVVTAVSGSGIDTKATVNFENVGVKQLLLRFAKFTRLEEDPPRPSL